jgi:DNA-binding MarR family transcriptional regulator
VHCGRMDDARCAAEEFARRFPMIYLRFHRRDAKGPTLSAASRSVLQHLALAGPVTIGELSVHLGRAQSVVSEIVGHLEAADLLERQEDPGDRRRRLVWLSADGRKFLERDRDVLSVELLEPAFASMTRAERKALLSDLDRLLAADDASDASPTTLPTHEHPRARRKDHT